MLIVYKFNLWLIALLFLIWAVFSSKWFTFLDNHTLQQARDEHLDSLRFFLAFFVAIFHYAMCYVFFHGHGWSFETIENYTFVKKMGSFGVSVFFMISGYLFSDSKPNSWLQFYKKRYYRIAPIFFLSSIISIYIIYPHKPRWAVFIALFAIGGLSKQLPRKLQIPKHICDIGIVLTITFLFLIPDNRYNIYYLPLMAIMFVLIAMGGDIFGILRQKAFVRLGAASYSIYLLHGIAWFSMNKIIQVHHLTLSGTQYTLLTTIVVFILLMICTFTYYYIEKPCIELGRRKIKWIKADSQS